MFHRVRCMTRLIENAENCTFFYCMFSPRQETNAAVIREIIKSGTLLCKRRLLRLSSLDFAGRLSCLHLSAISSAYKYTSIKSLKEKKQLSVHCPLALSPETADVLSLNVTAGLSVRYIPLRWSHRGRCHANHQIKCEKIKGIAPSPSQAGYFFFYFVPHITSRRGTYPCGRPRECHPPRFFFLFFCVSYLVGSMKRGNANSGCYCRWADLPTHAWEMCCAAHHFSRLPYNECTESLSSRTDNQE